MSILKNTKKRIILNAGHWDDPDTPHVEDPGASANGVKEAIEVIKIRDRVIPLLQKAGFEVLVVPDHLNLRESIAWANTKAPSLNDGLAIDIHLNYLSDARARGSESFYGHSTTSNSIATALTVNTSKELGIPNRGAKPDTQTAIGELGWIRKTSMWASLIEVCFLTNTEDMEALHGPQGYDKAALGIVNGICEIYGVLKLTLPVEQPVPVESGNDIIISIEEGGETRKFTCQPIND